jgi:2-oxoglutarate ferredoxin oxidoreductase subunit alpha
VAIAHLRHLNPLPANTGEVLRNFPRVLCVETNTGQLANVLRARYLVDVESYGKVEGLPLFAAEVEEQILERLR